VHSYFCRPSFQQTQMKEAILYNKDDRWFIESEDYLNTFTSKDSAILFANFYKIQLHEKS